MVGKLASSGFRGALESALPDHKEQRSALYLLLDDIPVTTLISVTADGVPTIIHEYVVGAAADATTLTITEISATPHVLPWAECPFAADSAGDLVGRSLIGLRRYVRDSLTGVPSCTHLNDLLPSLDDAVGLAALV